MKRIVLPLLLAIIVSGCSKTGTDLGSDSLETPTSNRRNPDVPYALTSSQEAVYAFASLEDLTKAGIGQVDKIDRPGIRLRPNVRYILLNPNHTFRSRTLFGGELDADAMKIVMPNNDERFVAARKMKILKAACHIEVEEIEKNNFEACYQSGEALGGQGRGKCLIRISDTSQQCDGATTRAIEKERQWLSRKNQ